MGRHRIPDHLRLLTGNPGKRSYPPPIQPASGEVVPDPPEFLSPTAAKEWHRIAGELHRCGRLSVLDTTMFACYCEAYSSWRDAVEAGTEAGIAPKAQQVLRGIARDAQHDMLKLARQFGMSPASRNAVSVVSSRQPGKFDGLLGGPAA